MFETMMKDDEKGKCLTEKGIYVDRNLHVQKLNSQECFYEVAYANAEKKTEIAEKFSDGKMELEKGERIELQRDITK